MAVLDPVTAGYLAGWKLVGRLPESVTGRVFARGADWASGNGAGPEMLRRNLTRVVGPERVTRELVRDAMRSYARYWHGAFRLPQLAGQPGLLAELGCDHAQGTHLSAPVPLEDLAARVADLESALAGWVAAAEAT